MNLFTKLKFYVGLSLCLSLSSSLFGQEPVENKQQLIKHFNGTITTTNNGISIIPSFSLGRPAVFFDLSVGGDRLSFDPMFRFGLDGKPWSFVFWWRYKIIKDKKFTLSAGAHPAFIFSEKEVLVDGKPEVMLVSQRFLAFELNSNYKISNRVNVGIYYLQGNGFNPIPPKTSHYLALNTSISDLPLVGDIRWKLNPQFFYLKVDDNHGTYFNSSLTITKRDFPLGIQTFFNKKINSEISGDDLVWNVSLLYSFANTYQKN